MGEEHKSQVGEDQLKLKIIVLYDDSDKEIHTTQPVGFIAGRFGFS